MWKHVKKFKGKVYLGNYEYNRAGKRVFVLKNASTGVELKPFKNYQEAQKAGWVKSK